jgi:hypothetical protein
MTTWQLGKGRFRQVRGDAVLEGAIAPATAVLVALLPISSQLRSSRS